MGILSGIHRANGAILRGEDRILRGDWMSTLSLGQGELPTTAVDDFSALEQRILRAVEVVKHERATRVEAEATAARLQSEKDAQATRLEQAQEQLHTLEKER
jgi:hypothetical protein